MMFRHRRTVAAAALAAAAVSGMSACSAVLGEEESLVDATSLTVGVKADQPGLGLEDGEGGFEGFDVDVALYIAQELGIPEGNVEFVGVTSDQREDVLDAEDPLLVSGRRVDMVVATYSITPVRKTEVTFAGPYYVAKQDVLVRSDAAEIGGVRDLEGLDVCQGEGSNSTTRITEGLGIDVVPTEEPTYTDCIDLLREGGVDAVSTDNLILAGFLAEDPSAFRLVNNPFTDEKYGVGLRFGDVAACEAVNRAISKMYQEGEAAELLDEWFGGTGLETLDSVPQFEGCA
ncbi:glutamate ABC transporter substrate-binding protein [Nocardiopsis tropica]|uniref:Glutamate ABC transporter substrate-binding protein n=1 Tax=Nocardiopsis tropica TaxID=109330 RepID=A0ABU7KJ02_9ACTN|nr:glutamate ABC transporter substrate-binding protein [Nocardiopsis umidischolae]MEE2049087.1 glutamate ABC transporter substrate-binding protein [Nocardiopsis umidischolae]